MIGTMNACVERESNQADCILKHISSNLQREILIAERLTCLRDKLLGGRPTPQSAEKNAPQTTPCGFMAMIEHHASVSERILASIDEVLSDLHTVF